jgi:tetratricopeptide (TPR) repeat protein
MSPSTRAGRRAPATMPPMDVSALSLELRKAVESGDGDAAWALLTPHEPSLGHDLELTRLWLDLLRLTPQKGTLEAEVELALGGFAAEPAVVIAACAALLARAARRAPDEPPLRDDGPAQKAARAARRCLDALSEEQRRDPHIGGFLYGNLANGLRLAGPKHDKESHAAFYQALEIAPERGDLWHDLGLLHKWRGRWDNAYAAFLKARARLGETKPVLFNLAISATGLGEGDVAAGALKQLGMPVELGPDGKLPFVPGLPPAQVRVLSRGAGYATASAFPNEATAFEVLWVQPLSPCHGVVVSPCFRDAPIDYGDLVLFDPAPVAQGRDAEGNMVPCFPLLEILKRGEERRLRFIAYVEREGAFEEFSSALPEGFTLFRQSERIESARPSVLTGKPLEKPVTPVSSKLVHGKIVCAPEVGLEPLKAYIQSSPFAKRELALAIPGLYEALGQTKRAGQEHQAYRGIERKAERHGS